MDKLKSYFQIKGERFIAFWPNLWKSTIEWFVALWAWILYMPRSFKKAAIRHYTNLITTPKRTKEWFKKVRNTPVRVIIKKIGKAILNRAILIALVIIILYIGISDPHFFTARTVSNILTTSSYRLLFALGVGTIIVGKGTDLSVGRVVGFCALVGGVFSQDIAQNPYIKGIVGESPVVIIILTMVVGALFGFVSGFIVTKFRVDPFIATLGMMLVAYGGSYLFTHVITNGATISGFSDKYKNVVATPLINLGGIKITAGIIVSFVIAFLMWVMWNKTPIGKKIFAVGGNASAAAVSGIKVNKVLLFTYVLGGALYGIGATLLTWYTGAVSPETATMYELDAIAACIVGGLSFDGGRGKISGIVIGVIIFECITLGFGMLGMQTYMIYIVKGLIIIFAIAFDMLKVRKAK